MNKTPSLIIKLFIISAIAALVLAATNKMTAPIIASRQEEEFKKAFTEAYPDGKDFKSIETKVNENLEEVIEVSDGSGVVGYVFKTLGKGGYGGDISFIVGVSNDGVIQGFKALKHSETTGYGSKIEDDAFVEGVNGVNISKGVTYGSGNKETGEIQQISGATRSTSAVTGGLYAVAQKMGDLSDKIEPLGDVVVPYFASNYADMFAGADKYKEVKNEIKYDNLVRIIDAFKGEELLGHIVQLKATGFGGDINLLLAVKTDNKIEKFVIASHNESPDYGKNIETDLYRDHLEDNTLNGRIKLKANPGKDNDILLISGATVTSMAMQDAMNSAVNGLKDYAKITPEYEDIDVNKIVAEEQATEEPPVDYLAFFEGVGALEPVGEELLNDNVTAINKTDSGDFIIDVKSQEGVHPMKAGILVDANGTIKEFVYYEFGESADYGDVAGEQAYIDKLIKQNLKDNAEFNATPEGDGQGEVQAVSEATLTTNAIKEIMTKAAEAFKGLK